LNISVKFMPESTPPPPAYANYLPPPQGAPVPAPGPAVGDTGAKSASGGSPQQTAGAALVGNLNADIHSVV